MNHQFQEYLCLSTTQPAQLYARTISEHFYYWHEHFGNILYLNIFLYLFSVILFYEHAPMAPVVISQTQYHRREKSKITLW